MTQYWILFHFLWQSINKKLHNSDKRKHFLLNSLFLKNINWMKNTVTVLKINAHMEIGKPLNSDICWTKAITCANFPLKMVNCVLDVMEKLMLFQFPLTIWFSVIWLYMKLLSVEVNASEWTNFCRHSLLLIDEETNKKIKKERNWLALKMKSCQTWKWFYDSRLVNRSVFHLLEKM